MHERDKGVIDLTLDRAKLPCIDQFSRRWFDLMLFALQIMMMMMMIMMIVARV